MGRYYEKSVGNGEKLLYDSDGKCIGRGVTDRNGKTIYSCGEYPRFSEKRAGRS